MIIHIAFVIQLTSPVFRGNEVNEGCCQSPKVRAATELMVSPTMKALVDAVWAVWSIGASIYDYIHTNAMEERIHTLESVITVHQCVIGLLSAGLVALFTYILLRKQ